MNSEILPQAFKGSSLDLDSSLLLSFCHYRDDDTKERQALSLRFGGPISSISPPPIAPIFRFARYSNSHR
jgi:hypothetical protein